MIWFSFLKYLSELSLGCCALAFSSCSGWAYSLAPVRALLIVMASLVAEDRLQSTQAQQCGECA